MTYYNNRNKGAYSTKAKTANLQRYADAFRFLQAKQLFTTDDLDTALHSMQNSINAMKASVGEKQSRIKELDELLRTADLISLHCPLTPETHELVNARRLALMKPNAILINTGRGPLVNEQDLADALNSGKIYAAGVDVLSSEPPRADNPLLTAKNCYITPHIAWASTEARERLMNIAISNLQAYISGTPENVVNK